MFPWFLPITKTSWILWDNHGACPPDFYPVQKLHVHLYYNKTNQIGSNLKCISLAFFIAYYTGTKVHTNRSCFTYLCTSNRSRERCLLYSSNYYSDLLATGHLPGTISILVSKCWHKICGRFITSSRSLVVISLVTGDGSLVLTGSFDIATMGQDYSCKTDPKTSPNDGIIGSIMHAMLAKRWHGTAINEKRYDSGIRLLTMGSNIE